MPWTMLPAVAALCCAALSPLSLVWGLICLISPASRQHGTGVLVSGMLGGLALLSLFIFLFMVMGENLGPRPLPLTSWAQAFSAGFGLIGCPAMFVGLAAPWFGFHLRWLELRPQIGTE